MNFQVALLQHNTFSGSALLGGFSCPTPLVAHRVAVAKTISHQEQRANPALNLAPFGRWTLRDKAAQRRLALR